MAEDLKKKQDEQLQEEQLDEVNGGIWATGKHYDTGNGRIEKVQANV